MRLRTIVNAIDETTIGMKSTSLWDIMMSGAPDVIETGDVKEVEDEIDASVNDTDVTSASPPASPLIKGTLNTRHNFSVNRL